MTKEGVSEREAFKAPDAWWSSVIKRAFEQGVSEAFIAWQDMQAATQHERERCAQLMEPSMSAIQLIAGELSAQEQRTVRAVLTWLAQCIRTRSEG